MSRSARPGRAPSPSAPRPCWPMREPVGDSRKLSRWDSPASARRGDVGSQDTPWFAQAGGAASSMHHRTGHRRALWQGPRNSRRPTLHPRGQRPSVRCGRLPTCRAHAGASEKAGAPQPSCTPAHWGRLGSEHILKSAGPSVRGCLPKGPVSPLEREPWGEGAPDGAWPVTVVCTGCPHGCSLAPGSSPQVSRPLRPHQGPQPLSQSPPAASCPRSGHFTSRPLSHADSSPAHEPTSNPSSRQG